MITATLDTFPLARAFTISRGSKTEARVITATVTRHGITGRGESVPYARYGETPEGVLAAAAIKCLGGEIAGRLWPRDEAEREAAIEAGYDLERTLTSNDLVSGEDVFFAATGVTDGDLLRGVRRLDSGFLTTESLVMRSRSGTVRKIEARHDRAKLREVTGGRYG